MALSVEEHEGELWLVKDDCQGEPTLLAQFADEVAASIFVEELRLAKLCAHAAGASGI